MNNEPRTSLKLALPQLVSALLAASVLIGTVATAAVTDLANQPLATTEVNARPNLMFILDDSGSMGYDFIPEFISDWTSYKSTYGYLSSQCNGLAYNASTTYKPPKTALNKDYPAMSATAAWSDGYLPSFASSPTAQSSSTAQDMSVDTTPPSGGTSKTFAVSSVSGFASPNVVVIKSGSSDAHWMMGTISSVSSTAKTITVLVTFSTADGSISYNNWTIGAPSGTNLTTSNYYYTYDYNYGSQPQQRPMSYAYDSTGALVTNTFLTECQKTSGEPRFTKVLVSSLSADQKINYANWYAYYRKRVLAMRAATGLAFSGLTDNFRVGFTVISDTDTVAGSNGFLPVDNFVNSQKITFFNNLYSSIPGPSTPLRGALSKIGRYYANASRGQAGHLVSGQSTATPDPVQYTCQRNYTLLSTDGYWNTSNENSSKGYGPYKVDGTTPVGQVDGFDGRPQYDGSITTTTTSYSIGSQTDTTSLLTKTVTTHPQGDKTVVSGCSRTNSGLLNYLYTCTFTTTQGYSNQDAVSTATRKTTAGSKQTETIITTNGKVTSDKFTPPTPAPFSNSVDTSYSSATNTNTAWTQHGTVTGPTVRTCTTPKIGTNVCPTYVNGTTYAADSTNTTNIVVTQTSTSGAYSFNTQISTNTTTTGGAGNSLADIAEYYYVTPFRTSTTVNCALTPDDTNCKGDLSPSTSGPDAATYQHMTTFTLGIGVSGQFTYDPDYLDSSKKSGDYYNVKRGYNDANVKVDWPLPYDPSDLNQDVPGKIDDLWHAAVNGRGQYFSSSNSSSLAASLGKVMTTILASNGYSGAAAASALKPLLGKDQVYLASYTTLSWDGDVKALLLEKNAAGQVVPTTQKWSAASQLAGRAYDDRVIYYYGTQTVGTQKVNALVRFNYANLSADGLSSQFDNMCSRIPAPQQCASLAADDKTNANSGTNLVNYLRGERTYEITSGKPGYPFRGRTSPLGDLINASPVYVGAPPFKYADTGYSTFITDQTNRPKTIYAAANDGMLHAFSADTDDGGTERWAFIPKAVMSNMVKLADTAYKDNHLYFVDGTPVVGDVQDSNSVWHTILVGGLNKGGKAYYALDVTDPTAPKMLWQFDTTNDSDLGYTYGNPIITKIKDQSSATGASIWVAIFSSGYNNTDGTGTGVGALYIVNATTGALIRKIKTTVPDPKDSKLVVEIGSKDTPAGLGKINAWIDSETDNSATRIYGADLLGNVWRFDLNGTYEPFNKSMLLAQLGTQSVDSKGATVISNTQPVMARPELAEVSYGNTRYPVVMIGTGRYLGQTDLKDTSSQSVYAIKDPLTSTGWGGLKGNSNLVTQTLVDVTGGRAIQSPANTVDWSTKIGWTVALPTPKERVAIDMNLQFNTLNVVSAVPQGTACAPSGQSWVYFLNVNNGASTVDGDVIGTQMSSGLGTGTTWFDLGDGNSVILAPDDKMGIHTFTPPKKPPSEGGAPKRTSWRELIN